jgi:hypothetical protein
MSPTIVLRNGQPEVAVGSPGGSTIITTVLQILVEHLDFGRPLPDALATPRASQRNTASVSAEPAFIASADGAGVQALGHTLANGGEIGAATGIDFQQGGVMQAVAEPVRRGGGHAEAIGPRGRAVECGGGVVVTGALRAGRTVRIRAELLLRGTPAGERRVIARGAGVRANATTNVRGVARFRARLGAAGTLVIRIAGTPCAARFRVQAATGVAAGGAGLTGRRF